MHCGRSIRGGIIYCKVMLSLIKYNFCYFQKAVLGRFAGWNGAGGTRSVLKINIMKAVGYQTCVADLAWDVVPYITPDKFCAHSEKDSGVSGVIHLIILSLKIDINFNHFMYLFCTITENPWWWIYCGLATR